MALFKETLAIGLGALSLIFTHTTPEQSANKQAPEESAYRTPEVVSQADLLRVDRHKKQFRITDGTGEGDTVAMRLKTEQGGGLTLEFEGLYRIALVEENGALCMRRFEMIEEGQTVEYDPVVVFIPATAQAGREIASRAEARVLEAGETTNVGTAEHVIGRIARGEFTLPGGSYEGFLIEFEHTLNVPLATITIDLEIGTDGDEGIIYWRAKSVEEKLGMFGETTIRQLEVTELNGN